MITALYMYGFIVTAVIGDGAAEDHAAFKEIGTRTLEELLPQLQWWLWSSDKHSNQFNGKVT